MGKLSEKKVIWAHSPGEEVTSAVAGAASHTAYSIKKQRATSEQLFVLSSLSPFTLIQDPRPRNGVTQGTGLSISVNPPGIPRTLAATGL